MRISSFSCISRYTGNSLERSRFPRINIQLDTNIARGNYATLAGGCYTMILGKRYSIPPGGMVLKDRLQLGNMWRSDHLSRKRTRRVLRRGTTTHLALTYAPLSAVSPCARWDGPFMRDWLDFVEGARLPRTPRSQCQGVTRWLTENRRCYVRHVNCPHVRSHET